jgi:transposase
MWLTRRLAPDFKTIAKFRKDNGKAIRNVCPQFIVLCQQLDLFSDAVVVIDGSKFKAVNRDLDGPNIAATRCYTFIHRRRQPDHCD